MFSGSKSNLSSAKGYQTDSAISYIERSLDNVKDVQSAADEARRKDVSTDDHYKEEKESHERPLSDARKRVENCTKVDNMSY